jgi:hypothetical protein
MFQSPKYGCFTTPMCARHERRRLDEPGLIECLEHVGVWREGCNPFGTRSVEAHSEAKAPLAHA